LAQARTLTLGRASSPGSAGAGASPASLLAGGFTAGVSINLGGTIYSASADALLKAGHYSTWLSGPVVNEWMVDAPLTAAGSAHPHLSARFSVRNYTGTGKTRVDVTIENDWAFEPGPQNFTYDATILVGGQTVYSKPGLKHYHHARWRKLFWQGDASAVNIQHDTPYLIASKAVPNYDQTTVFAAADLNALSKQFSGAVTEPMAVGLAQPYMPTTGGRPDIGLMPSWAATYLLSMDPGAKAVTLGTADLAGSWSIHYRDKNTGRPVRLMDYPYMTILGTHGDTFNPATKKYEAFPSCGGTCTNPATADSSHEPAFAYLPYVVTGDYYYLEELEFWTMWNIFQSNPGYRGNIQGLIHSNQVRGQAWVLRSLAEASYIVPDSDSTKQQFNTVLSNNLDWYNNTYANNSRPDNALGALLQDGAIDYDNGTGIAPWMDDFFTSAAGRAKELGYSKAQTLLAWKAGFPVARMMDPNFCWIQAGVYNLHVRATSTSPIYTSLAPAYNATLPLSFTSLACGSSAMASLLGLKVGEMTGYSSSETGYPSNLQPALAYSVDSGVAGASAAWSKFMARSVKPNYGKGPQFAIVPRTH
jgi:hypothetical protein